MMFIILFIFLISVACTSGSIILASGLRRRYNQDISSSLFYYLVFIFTFGFYGIWGHLIIKAYLDNLSLDLLSRVTDIAMLLGFPFLIFAWLMLIRFAFAFSGIKFRNIFIITYLVINILVVIVPGFLFSKEESTMPSFFIKVYFIVLNLIYSSVCAIVILKNRHSNNGFSHSDKRNLGFILFIPMLFQNTSLLFYPAYPITGLVFILIFFLSNSFLPIYLKYRIIIPEYEAEVQPGNAFESFCLMYEISPREKEIVREICNGLSNKEISDKLFISLQTVKDHTHRIYSKVNVRSRTQLMNLVRDTK